MGTFERFFAQQEFTPQSFSQVNARGIADTGQGLEAAALQQAGGALTGTAGVLFKWNEREGNSQYDTSRGLANSLIGEHDRTDYADTTALEAGKKKLEADLSNVPTKNGLKNKSGQRKFKQWLELNKEGREKVSAEKQIRMVARNNQVALFGNLDKVSEITDRAKALTEIDTLIQGGLDDGSIKTASQAFAIKDKITDDWLNVDTLRRATTITRPDGEIDWTETVDWLNQPQNTEGVDQDILKSLKSNAESELTNQKKRDEQALESQREASRDLLNDKFANNQIPTPDDIDSSNLSEAEQQSYIKWSSQETRRVASGEVILTNQKIRADLNTMALDIWRGAVTKETFDKAVNEARYGENPTIDDPTYKELTNTAASTLKSAQAEALSRADTEAGRLIVDVRDEDAFADFLKGLDTTNRDKETDKRQLQFWYLSQYNKEIRDWVTENPDKIGKDFYQFSEALKHDYWNSSIKDIEAKKLERETSLESPGTVSVISPDGIEGTIPTSQLEDALKEGYKKVE